MTTLILVRHGQASFAGRNYDQLSPLGQRQSRALGEFWRQLRRPVDAWYAGTMARHRGTADATLAALGGEHAGITSDPAFDEYDHAALIRAYLPSIATEHPDLAVDRRKIYSDPKLFQRFFERVIAAWLSGAPAEGVPETWPQFCERVREGLARIAPLGTERVVVFTSGGVITVALRQALGVSDADAFRANWRIYNASVHTFVVGRRGLALTGFNNIAHLELQRDPALLTLR